MCTTKTVRHLELTAGHDFVLLPGVWITVGHSRRGIKMIKYNCALDTRLTRHSVTPGPAEHLLFVNEIKGGNSSFQEVNESKPMMD